MAVARVQGEDGKIHRIEVPDGATPAEIEAFANETIPKALPDVTMAEAAAIGATKGVPFGLDIVSALGAAAYAPKSDRSFLEDTALAKKHLERVAESAAQEYPIMSGGMQGMTALPLAVAMTPSSLLKGGSVLERAGRGAVAAGGLGALYGAGEGQGAGERASNAITQGVTSAPFGAAGSVVSDVAGAAIGGLASRAKSLFSKIGQSRPNIVMDVRSSPSTAEQMQSALNRPIPIQALTADKIPLTRGQALQAMPNMAKDAAKAQSLEYGAATGIYGQEAQQMALQARELQSSAAKESLGKIAGKELTPDSPLQDTAAMVQSLKSAYKSAKAKTTAAYNKVGDLSGDKPLQIAHDYIKNAIIPNIKDWARKGSSGRPWDLSNPEMANAKRLYNQAAAMGDMDKISAVNFFRMEDWRGRVSQGIASSKNPSEKAFLSGLLQRYDTSMSVLPREAIKNGDDAILDAMEKARYARKEQGVLFERSKLVKDILTNDDITNEQFANSILSLGAKSGSYVRDILRTAKTEPAKHAELVSQIKQSLLGNVLNKSLSSEVTAAKQAGNIESMVSFDKLSTQLDKLVKNKTLFNQVFNEMERASVLDALKASQLIKSVKPGSKNYSNTAYTILNIMRSISPLATEAGALGISAGSFVEKTATTGAVQDLSKSLEPVLKGALEKHTTALTNFGQKYGRPIMSLEPTIIREQSREKQQ